MDRTDHPRARVRPWIKRVAIVALPVLLVMLGVAAWDYVEIRRLNREVEAIRAKGEPVTALSLIDADYAAAENSEYKYSAAGLLSLAPSAQGFQQRPPDRERGSAMAAYAQFTPIRQWLGGATPRPPLDGIGETTQSLMTEWEEALSLVDKGAALPYHGINPGSEYNYRVAGLMNLLRLLSARTIGLSTAGDGDAAVESAISSIRLRRAIRPSQRWLPVAAHEVPAILSLSKPSDQALERLQGVLQQEEDPDAATRDFIEMRARIIDEAWRRWFRAAPGAQVPAPFPQELVPSPGVRPLYTHGFVRTLRVWAELIDIARKPWPERLARSTDALARHRKGGESERWAGGLGVNLAAALLYSATRPDVLVYDRGSRVAVAIERYRRARGDALPGALTDLVPQYIDRIPEDPVTGEPLRYRATADAYVVYSVGLDREDDGGMLLRQTPPSAAVQFEPGADMGVRVVIRSP